jgi:hypothetical protein
MLYVCQLGIITLSPSVHATMVGHPFIFSPIYFFNFSFIVQFSQISKKNSCKLIIIKTKKKRNLTFFFFFFGEENIKYQPWQHNYFQLGNVSLHNTMLDQGMVG